jgi:transcriptional regulator with XRE-family HTH domain
MYKKLRDYRLQNNISVDALCKLIGITDVSNYYRREQGETEFKLEEAKKICEHLGLGMEIFEVL